MEGKGYNLRISILETLIMKIETEIKLYKKTKKIIYNTFEKIKNDYHVALQIGDFIDKVMRMEDKGEIKREYEMFIKKQISENIKYGDIFNMDLNCLSSDKVSYNIRAIGNIDKYIPDVAAEKIYQMQEALKCSGEKVIVNSILYFEQYFCTILRTLIYKKPEAYLYGKELKFSDIVNKDFEKLKCDLVEECVSNLMHGVAETINKVNKIHDLKLDKYSDIWNSYIEADLHRNIIMHNNGEINNEYLNKLPNNKGELKVGTYLKCDDNCIYAKTNNIIKFAYLLLYLIGNNDEDFVILQKSAFDFLKKEQWELAEFCYNLLMKIKNINYDIKMDFNINRLNAKKHLVGMEKARKEIENLDVSGMNDSYLIAKELLLENNENIIKLLETNYPNVFGSYHIESWPIFIEFRKSDEYKRFREEHKKDFELHEYKINQTPDIAC